MFSTSSLLFSVANAKTKTHMKLIFQIFHFAHKIQQNFTIQNGVETLENTPKYTNFSMVRHENFHTNKHANLHHLATLLNNTNAVSNPEKGDHTVHGVFCLTFTKFTAKLQII